MKLSTMEVLKMQSVRKRRGAQEIEIPAFVVQQREQIAITGHSGAGKTTLLHLISGILAADSGSIVLAGEELVAMNEARRDRLRARIIGYVFQTFNLLQGLTALENVVVAAAFAGNNNHAASKAKALLVRLGLEQKMEKYPATLSVGEQQRVAVARALINKPMLVLADEPTANLDTDNAQRVLHEMRELATDEGSALLVVTHATAIATSFTRVLPVEQIIQTTAVPQS